MFVKKLGYMKKTPNLENREQSKNILAKISIGVKISKNKKKNLKGLKKLNPNPNDFFK